MIYAHEGAVIVCPHCHIDLLQMTRCVEHHEMMMPSDVRPIVPGWEIKMGDKFICPECGENYAEAGLLFKALEPSPRSV